MSGNYNQVKQSTGEWEIFEPHKTGKYDKYETERVVIVLRGRKNKGNKLIIPTRVWETMGSPEWCSVGMRGSNVAIIPLEKDNSRAYRIARAKDHDTKKETGFPFINLQAFINKLDIDAGVYAAHIETGGVLVFDRASKPSKI